MGSDGDLFELTDQDLQGIAIIAKITRDQSGYKFSPIAEASISSKVNIISNYVGAIVFAKDQLGIPRPKQLRVPPQYADDLEQLLDLLATTSNRRRPFIEAAEDDYLSINNNAFSEKELLIGERIDPSQGNIASFQDPAFSLDGESNILRLRSVFEYLEKYEGLKTEPVRLLLIGEPGSGKSHFLVDIAQRIAQENTFIPLRVKLDEFRPLNFEKRFIGFLHKRVKQINSDIVTFKDLLVQGNLILLIDGIEVLPLRSKIASTLIEFVNTNPKCGIILAAEPGAEAYLNDKINSLTTCYLKSLDEPEQFLFLESSLSETQLGLSRKMRAIPTLRRLLGNPYFIHGTKDFIQGLNADSNDIWTILNDFFNYLLTKYTDCEEFNILADLAAFMLLQKGCNSSVSDSITFTKDELASFLYKYNLTVKVDCERTLDQLVEEKILTKFFVNYSPVYKFQGAPFLSFFASRYLLAKTAKNPYGKWSELQPFFAKDWSFSNLIDWVSLSDTFGEMLVFLCLGMRDGQVLVSELLDPGKDDIFHHRSCLAMACLRHNPDLLSHLDIKTCTRVDEVSKTLSQHLLQENLCLSGHVLEGIRNLFLFNPEFMISLMDIFEHPERFSRICQVMQFDVIPDRFGEKLLEMLKDDSNRQNQKNALIWSSNLRRAARSDGIISQLLDLIKLEDSRFDLALDALYSIGITESKRTDCLAVLLEILKQERHKEKPHRWEEMIFKTIETAKRLNLTNEFGMRSVVRGFLQFESNQREWLRNETRFGRWFAVELAREQDLSQYDKRTVNQILKVLTEVVPDLGFNPELAASRMFINTKDPDLRKKLAKITWKPRPCLSTPIDFDLGNLLTNPDLASFALRSTKDARIISDCESKARLLMRIRTEGDEQANHYLDLAHAVFSGTDDAANLLFPAYFWGSERTRNRIVEFFPTVTLPAKTNAFINDICKRIRRILTANKSPTSTETLSKVRSDIRMLGMLTSSARIIPDALVDTLSRIFIATSDCDPETRQFVLNEVEGIVVQIIAGSVDFTNEKVSSLVGLAVKARESELRTNSFLWELDQLGCRFHAEADVLKMDCHVFR